MRYFIVTGEISHFDPTDCDGYGMADVRVRVEAGTEHDAPEAALIALSKRYPMPEWSGLRNLPDFPDGVESVVDDGEVPEAVLMRRAGAPELPLEINACS